MDAADITKKANEGKVFVDAGPCKTGVKTAMIKGVLVVGVQGPSMLVDASTLRQRWKADESDDERNGRGRKRVRRDVVYGCGEGFVVAVANAFDERKKRKIVIGNVGMNLFFLYNSIGELTCVAIVSCNLIGAQHPSAIARKEKHLQDVKKKVKLEVGRRHVWATF